MNKMSMSQLWLVTIQLSFAFVRKYLNYYTKSLTCCFNNNIGRMSVENTKQVNHKSGKRNLRRNSSKNGFIYLKKREHDSGLQSLGWKLQGITS